MTIRDPQPRESPTAAVCEQADLHNAGSSRERSVFNWLANQQPVLRRDLPGDRLRADAIALLLQSQGPHHIHGQRTIHPARQITPVVRIEVMTARHHSDAGTRHRSAFEHDIAEMSTRMHQDGSLKGNGRELTFADGRRLFVGSSGTGAPNDGKDPQGSKE